MKLNLQNLSKIEVSAIGCLFITIIIGIIAIIFGFFQYKYVPHTAEDIFLVVETSVFDTGWTGTWYDGDGNSLTTQYTSEGMYIGEGRIDGKKLTVVYTLMPNLTRHADAIACIGGKCYAGFLALEGKCIVGSGLPFGELCKGR